MSKSLKLILNIPLSDIIEFDQDFYDRQLVDAKILKRFLTPVNFNNENTELNLEDKPISIETPTNSDCLQNNMTYVRILFYWEFIVVVNNFDPVKTDFKWFIHTIC